MSSLHMYDPWHRNATQSINRSITHRPQRLSALQFCRPTATPLPSPCLPRVDAPVMLPVSLCSHSDDASSLPLTFPAYLSASPHLPDCRRQWTVKGGGTETLFFFVFFYIEEKLCVSQLVRRRALALPHGGRGRSRCWRVAVARLSGALVPLGRTFVVGRKLSHEQFAFATSVV